MDNRCICKIRDIYRAITHFELQLQRATGLNINEAMLLCLLSDGETRLAGRIADELGLTRSNASKVIASLERHGLILRQTCQEDSRCQLFHIGPRGLEKLERIHCDDLQMPPELRAL